MSDQPPDPGAQAGMQLSPDGRWEWNGSAWVPNPSAATRTPVPYSTPAPTQYAPLAYPAAGGYVVAPKSPAVSLIVSLFLPGFGLTILLLWLLASGLDVTVLALIVGVPLGLGMWIWGMIDAYQGAQRWNRRHGIIS